jgi:nucleoredoxin
VALTTHGFNLLGAPASADAGPFANLADKLKSHLVILDKNGTLIPFDGSLKNIKYFAFYHSASWCPPCRLFTPKLVKFYDEFKPQHPDFELIFVTHDNDTADMLDYMKSTSMKWPAVRYDDIDGSNLNDMDPDGGIPDLILTDANGKVLSDTFQNSEYYGADKVMGDIQRLVH